MIKDGTRDKRAHCCIAATYATYPFMFNFLCLCMPSYIRCEMTDTQKQ